MKQLRKLISVTVSAVFLMTCVMVPAQAAMVTTDKISTQAEIQQTRAKIAQFMARSDVQQHLIDNGVSPEEANSRIDSLSVAELNMLSDKIDSLPAAGTDALGVLVFVFLVLLITDIMGLTDIFPFVRKPR